MDRARGVLLLVLVMLAAACAPAPRRPLVLTLQAHRPESILFPVAPTLLDGFDVDEDAPPAAGDAILYGIAIHGETPQTWYIRLTLMAQDEKPARWSRSVEWGADRRVFEFESDVHPVNIELFNSEGKLLQAESGAIPTILLNKGLFDAASPDIPPDHIPGAAESRALGVLGIAAFTEALGSQQALQSVLWKIIDRPPWWTFLAGVDLSIEYSQGVATAAPHPAVADDARAALVPVDLTLNGHVVLRLSVLAAPSKTPLGLCGGALSIEGAGTRDDRPRLSARLLAAKRGNPETSTIQGNP